MSCALGGGGAVCLVVSSRAFSAGVFGKDKIKFISFFQIALFCYSLFSNYYLYKILLVNC